MASTYNKHSDRITVHVGRDFDLPDGYELSRHTWEYTLDEWQSKTDKAIALIESANPGTDPKQETIARLWLRANDLDSPARIQTYKELTADDTYLPRVCRCCGRANLRDKFSRRLGLGPECRGGKCHCRERAEQNLRNSQNQIREIRDTKVVARVPDYARPLP